tara:strand:- start:1575 stop:1778 length:204 start_codon:yes stop_codon:yes gene_type:complete
MKDFNLSDKAIPNTKIDKLPIGNVFYIFDVKEFIRREGELISDLYNEKITWNEFFKRRKKLMGAKLI